MAPSPHSIQVALLTLLFIFCSSSVECYASNSEEVGLQGRQKVLGSRPPGCVDKCFNCKPCRASLVIPSHQHKGLGFGLRSASVSKHEDDTYYLLSWKCRCGDKLFQP